MSIHPAEIIVSIFNLLVFYLVVRHFFFKKVQQAMETRKAAITADYNAANRDRQEAAALLADAEKTHNEAKETGVATINEYKAKAESLYEDILADGRQEARLILKRSHDDASRELEQAQKNIRSTVLEMSMELSRMAIGQDASIATHERLVDEVIDKVGEV